MGVHAALRDQVVIPTAERMREFGAGLSALLRPGDLVVLSGPLGAGKTVLAQGIAAGLGVHETVTSPTFVIARVYPHGRIPLVHVDAYRLGGIAEVDDLDLDADVDGSVTVVEWGAGLVGSLAPEHLEIAVARPTADESGEVRTLRLVPSGPGWAERLAELPAG
ncbi:tRNA (adenosine(37)-N6)-threonylcarbamoyltransferase complex ATPase subunit type 1 TsaE [Frankia sp. AgKG'84/4]|uniref:tRNA (adenosine(37)-N6)-threonylcarbamoyltransferase complex ATPase subunit type 1 TsaE n=1 Tax=Frankia sp. AgKG'84/4 TaxID=573490 RepID=UPI00200D732E|nr:tRNA (adenosine(37)-N6)-threonylcarbamoyltransferase complex ATPase subunit type 1 TsaE [Frankia sp. AgKG'84/4]MCL9793768.1 tRNA (adenosine(37)-N6)-threonylcarbamoyltransferase complex ATPase subunit type 1 TsaE [Frankia sp. AgKG'84/4]